MKRIKILFVIFLMLFSLIGCKTDEVKTDNIRFKEEYESINGQLNDKGKQLLPLILMKITQSDILSSRKLLKL